MKAKTLLKASALALLGLGSAFTSPPPVDAVVYRNESIFPHPYCHHGCVDVWKVECKDGDTHRVRANVRDAGAPATGVEVTIVGYVGPTALIGQSEKRVGDLGWSPPANLFRAGTTHGLTKALVLITTVHSSEQSSYEVGFTCHDVNDDHVGDPTVTLMQDDQP